MGDVPSVLDDSVLGDVGVHEFDGAVGGSCRRFGISRRDGRDDRDVGLVDRGDLLGFRGKVEAGIAHVEEGLLVPPDAPVDLGQQRVARRLEQQPVERDVGSCVLPRIGGARPRTPYF
jgi:hypothetical protein